MTDSLPIGFQVLISLLTGFFIALIYVIVMYFITSVGYLIVNLLKKRQLKPIIRGNFIVKLGVQFFFIGKLIIRPLIPILFGYGEPLDTLILGAYIVEPTSFFFLSSLFWDIRKKKSGNVENSQEIKLEQESNTITCKNCKNEIDVDSKFCVYCGSRIEMAEIFKEKKTRVNKFSNIILFLVTLIICGLGNGLISNYIKEQKELKDTENKEKQRISYALQNQTTYWSLDFASPDFDDTYKTQYTDYTRRYTCFLVGVKAQKNYNTYYSLSDSIDKGVFTLRLKDFSIATFKPLDYLPISDCKNAFDGYEPIMDSEFKLGNNETGYLLFEIKTDSIIEDSLDLQYRSKIITSLDTKIFNDIFK